MDWFSGFYILIKLIQAVPCVEHHIFLRCFDQDADGVAGVGIVPAVGAQKSYFYIPHPGFLLSLTFASLPSPKGRGGVASFIYYQALFFNHTLAFPIPFI